jgi:hypothetical protein
LAGPAFDEIDAEVERLDITLNELDAELEELKATDDVIVEGGVDFRGG